MAETPFALREQMHLHLVGIGGSGMSAIARVLLGRGFRVSGCDAQANELTAILVAEGATIHIGHAGSHVQDVDALVVSSAIPTDNPDLVAAWAADVPVLKRADLLGQLMEGTTGIAVAGTHGKTTTTGMIAHILLAAGRDPTVVLGGVLPDWGTNGRYGAGGYFVAEADEYDYMFLGLRPTLAVITNIEHDHPDMFPTDAAYQEAFRQFAQQLPADGRLILSGEDAGVLALLPTLSLPGVKTITYGIDEADSNGSDPDLCALDCRPNSLGGTDFLVERERQTVGLVRLRVPGLHNVRNALAAIAVSQELEIDFTRVVQALASFGGVGRRFQVAGEVGGVTIIDDYAHHPTEIRATLAAAVQRYPGRRLWAVWQPHTYSRTKLLLEQFATSFTEADRVIALDIYRSRETDTLGIDTAVVVQAMSHPAAIHIPERRDAANYLLDRVRPGDVILTLGAGDGNLVGQWVLDGLTERVKTTTQ